MDMDKVKKIRELFTHQRELEAEIHFYNARCLRNDKGSEKLQKHIDKVQCILEGLKGFYLIISEDEALVIRRHLVDKIDWPRIAVEYEQRWGENYAKSERTMIYYQKTALQKIVNFMKTYYDLYDFSWFNNDDE